MSKAVGKALSRKLKFYNQNGNIIGTCATVIDSGSSLSLVNSNTELLKRIDLQPMEEEIDAVGAFGKGPNFIGQVTMNLKIDNQLRPVTFLVVTTLNHSMILGFPDISLLGLHIRDGSCFTTDGMEVGRQPVNRLTRLTSDEAAEDQYVCFHIEERDINNRENLTLVSSNGIPYSVQGTYTKLPISEVNDSRDVQLYDKYEDFLMEGDNLERFCIPPLNQDSKPSPEVRSTFDAMWRSNAFDISNEVSNEDRNKLKSLILKYEPVLSIGKTVGKVPKSIGVFHQKFDIPEPRPIKIWHKSDEENNILHDEIEKLKQLGVISRIDTDVITTNMLVLPKPKDPSRKRVVLDLRKVNSWCSKLDFPLPKIQCVLRKLNMSNFYNCIDLASAFFSIQVAKSDRKWYTVLDPITLEAYAFDRLPQGHKNSPSFFQRFAAQTLRPGLEKSLEIYLDDCNSHTDTVKDSLRILEIVLDRCSIANLKINLKKLKLCSDIVICFGYQISRKGLTADPSRVKSLIEMKTPNESKKELKKAVASLNYYRANIKGFAIHAKILYDLTGDRTKFIWTEDHLNCWNNLIRELSEQILLYNIDDNLDLYLECDASNRGTGAILFQVHNGNKQIIEIYSHGLVGSESLWQISHLELKGIYIGLCKFQNYIGSKVVNIITDNTSVFFLLQAGLSSVNITKKTPAAKYLLYISTFNYTIRHTSGTDDSFLLTDLVSRLGKDCTNKYLTLGHNSKHPLITFEDLTEMAKSKSYPNSQNIVKQKAVVHNVNAVIVDNILDKIKLDEPSHNIINRIKLAQGDCPYIRKQIVEHNGKTNTQVIDGILYKIFPRGLCIICPKFYTEKFLSDIHRHESARKLIIKINSYKVYIYNKYKRVQSFVDKCDICNPARSTASTKVKDASVTIPTEPMATIHIDLWQVGTKINVLIIVDQFSGHICNRVLREPTATECINELMYFYTTYGPPQVIVSDNGPQFVAEEFEKFCINFGVLHKKAAPGNSRGNSPAEAGVNRCQVLMRIYQPPTDNQFHLYLSVLTFILNLEVQNKHKLSSFEIIFGRMATWALQCPELSKTKVQSMPESMRRLFDKMATARDQVINRAYEKRTQLQQSVKTRKPKIPNVGDIVRMKKFSFGKNYIKKLWRPYSDQKYIVKNKNSHTNLLTLKELVADESIRPRQFLRHARLVRRINDVTHEDGIEDPILGTEEEEEEKSMKAVPTGRNDNKDKEEKEKETEAGGVSASNDTKKTIETPEVKNLPKRRKPGKAITPRPGKTHNMRLRQRK